MSTSKVNYWVGPNDVVSGSTTLTVNNWFHVAVRYTGTLLTIYVNGSLDGMKALTGPITSDNTPIIVGGRKGTMTPTEDRFKGAIDELALYSKALPEKDIKDIANKVAFKKCH